MSNQANYRPEIDGLRTCAILPVIIYHLKIPLGEGYLLPGGFLGVDVFFVISGFLITQILLAELGKTGRISLANFYMRRARRILPALLLVILATLPFAYALMLPLELMRFATSIVAALGFFSNFYWFFELGQYGAQSGLLQPLLHTWSLAIEEQFYLLFPLLLLALPKARPALTARVFLWLIAISLVLAQISTALHPDFSFFSPVSRAWEILVGSSLALAMRERPEAGRGAAWLALVMPPLALVVLAVSFAVVDLAETAHPGLVTAPTVLATGALLWWTSPGETVTRTLSLRPVVYIGKLSYALYLWHFPVFAFGRLASTEPPGAADMAVWLAITFAGAALSYHLVERRFRFQLSTFAFGGAIAGSLAMLAAFVVTVHETDWLTGARAAELAALYEHDDFDNERLRLETWEVLNGFMQQAGAGGEEQTHNKGGGEALTLRNPDAIKVLVVGNSHSKDMFNALRLNQDRFEGFEFARYGVDGGLKLKVIDPLVRAPNFGAADVILLAPRYYPETIETLPVFLERLRRSGKPVVLTGNTAEFKRPGFQPLYDWFVQRAQGAPDYDAFQRQSYGYRNARSLGRNAQVKRIAEDTGLPFLSRYDLVCSDSERRCAIATPDGHKAMYDDHHWTVPGAKVFGAMAAEQGWGEALAKAASGGAAQ